MSAALLFFGVSAADRYIIRGTIPGLVAGSKVSLQGRDIYQDRDLGDTVSQTDAFVLEGSVGSPTIAQIRIELPDGDGRAFAIPLMVENAEYTIVAETVDSLPPAFYQGRHGRLLEDRVHITGGEAQRQYHEYRDATLAQDLHVKDAQEKFFNFRTRPKNDPYKIMLSADVRAAQTRMDEATDAFVAAHPEYSVSGRFVLEKLRIPFAMSGPELDRVEDGAAAMADTVRRQAVMEAVRGARKVMRDMPYRDFSVVDDKGTERNISEFVGKNYVFVDFWASWCGPCRAAIPHLKSIHETYGDRLTILSCSLDTDEDAWRKAMEQEQMPWAQFWATPDRAGAIRDCYRFGFIPFFMVISPDGKIAHAGINQTALDDFFEENIR